MATANVPIKAAWTSKINWTQLAALVVTAITTNVLGLPAETQAKVLAATTVVQSVLTFVFRTWFNGSVSPQSLPNG